MDGPVSDSMGGVVEVDIKWGEGGGEWRDETRRKFQSAFSVGQEEEDGLCGSSSNFEHVDQDEAILDGRPGREWCHPSFTVTCDSSAVIQPLECFQLRFILATSILWQDYSPQHLWWQITWWRVNAGCIFKFIYISFKDVESRYTTTRLTVP